MKYVLIYHIKVTFAFWSSIDPRFYRHVSREEFEKVNSKFIVYCEDEFLKTKICTLDTYKSKSLFGDNRQHPGVLLKIDELKQSGWSEDYPVELQMFFERAAALEKYALKEAGRILWKDYEDRVISDYYGGFSDAVVYHKKFQSYAANIPFGYIGHSARTKKLDRELEEIFMKRSKELFIPAQHALDLLVCWLTSTDGRHKTDNLESMDFEEQSVCLKSIIDDIIQISIVYMNPNHRGTYASTVELISKIRNN